MSVFSFAGCKIHNRQSQVKQSQRICNKLNSSRKNTQNPVLVKGNPLFIQEATRLFLFNSDLSAGERGWAFVLKFVMNQNDRKRDGGTF